MSTPRSLLSLNDDVLREILSHLLLATPPEPNRAAILRTCALLNELGLHLLYRVVDLRGYRDGYILLDRWKSLFGEGGLFTIEGGSTNGLAKMVKELRLGGEPDTSDDVDAEDDLLAAIAESLTIQKISLPSCSRLHIDPWNVEGVLEYLLGPLVSQLPIQHLHLSASSTHPPTLPPLEFEVWSFLPPSTLPSFLSNNSSASQPWTDLQTVVFEERVWTEDRSPYSENEDERLCLSDWSFKLLVFELTFLDPQSISTKTRQLEEILLPVANDPNPFLADTERVEVRTHGTEAGAFEVEFRKKVAPKLLNESQRRILELVVFVEEDGKERRLLEGL